MRRRRGHPGAGCLCLVASSGLFGTSAPLARHLTICRATRRTRSARDQVPSPAPLCCHRHARRRSRRQNSRWQARALSRHRTGSGLWVEPPEVLACGRPEIRPHRRSKGCDGAFVHASTIDGRARFPPETDQLERTRHCQCNCLHTSTASFGDVGRNNRGSPGTIGDVGHPSATPCSPRPRSPE